MLDLQKSNRISKPKFMSLTNVKAQQDVIYPNVIATRTNIHYSQSNEIRLPTNLASNTVVLDQFVEKHEPIRNYLSGKKLRGQKLSRLELIVLDELNKNLDSLLEVKTTDFQKEAKDLISEAKRIVALSGLGLG